MSALLDELLGPDADWRADALCAQTGADLHYPEKGEDARPAKKICGACPVITQCLQYAIDNDERYGVWGGLSERERRHLRPTTKTCATAGCTRTFPASGNHVRCGPCAAAKKANWANDQWHPWQARPRTSVPHNANETDAGHLVTGTAGPDLSVAPTGRTLEDDLARAEARRARSTRLTIAPTPRVDPASPERPAAPRPTMPRIAGTAQDRRRGPRTQPRADFVDLYEQGYTIPHIAGVFGTYPKTVRAHLVRAGVQLRDDRAGHSGGQNRRTFTPAQLSAMATAYLGGTTIADLATQHRTGRRQIRDALTELRIPIRPPAHTNQEAQPA